MVVVEAVVEVASDSPEGKTPDSRLQVYGDEPPCAVNTWEYSVPTVEVGKVVGVIPVNALDGVAEAVLLSVDVPTPFWANTSKL